jgi:hypothetical protein
MMEFYLFSQNLWTNSFFEEKKKNRFVNVETDPRLWYLEIYYPSY